MKTSAIPFSNFMNALTDDVSGWGNVAMGYNALGNVTSSYNIAAGYVNAVNGVEAANIGKINGVATADIDKVNGV